MGGKTSNASIQKYKQKAYDQVQILVPKGKREKIKLFAAEHGETVNSMINRLIAREMGEIHENDDELVTEMDQQPE